MTAQYKVHFPLVMAGGDPRGEALGRALRGVAGNAGRADLDERVHWRGHGIEWCHSWTEWHGYHEGIELIPMLWGRYRWLGGRRIDYLQRLNRNVPSDYDGWIIFINEPTLSGQANMTPREAAELWLQAIKLYPFAKWTSPQLLIGHDAPLYAGQLQTARSWLAEWWRLIPYFTRHRVRAWAYHNYIDDPQRQARRSLEWASWLRSGLDDGDRQELWVTEWGLGMAGRDDEGESAVRELRDWYDQQVDRHAFFTNYEPADEYPHSQNTLLFRADGTPTGLGRGWLS
jgi:hypothetical protein